jgi:hypothetical protein
MSTSPTEQFAPPLPIADLGSGWAPVLAFAARLNVRVDPVNDPGCPMPVWDGVRLAVLPGDGPAFAFHELAHWVMATPAERTMVDFGLGANETFHGFNGGDGEPAVEPAFQHDSVDDGYGSVRCVWADHDSVDMIVAGRREQLAVTAFLFMESVLGVAADPDGFTMWAEFGGDSSIDGISVHNQPERWMAAHQIAVNETRVALEPFTDLSAADWDRQVVAVNDRLQAFLID